MIILGRKHKFKEFELNQLKKISPTIIQIKYRDREESEVLKELSAAVKKHPSSLFVLNTKAKVGDEIIKYLTNLHVKEHKYTLDIISIETLMERYLRKCYIPDSH